MARRIISALTSVTVAAFVMTPAVAFAALDPTQSGGGDAKGGLWYVTDQGIEDSLAAGHRGQGVKIAVIDGRINPDVPALKNANIKIHEPSFCTAEDGSPITATTTLHTAAHGTAMTSLLAGDGSQNGPIGPAPNAEILFYSAFLDLDDVGAKPFGNGRAACGFGTVDPADAMASAIDAAIKSNADIISISMFASYSDSLFEAVKAALSKGIIFVVAHANEEGFPSYFKTAYGIFVVGSVDAAGKLATLDAEGKPLRSDSFKSIGPGTDILAYKPTQAAPSWDNLALSSGNSNTAPLIAGMLAAVMSKYPDATANQVLQAALHSTGEGNHDLDFDLDELEGYGRFNMAQTMKVDPTKYPDENPLIDKHTIIEPTYEQIWGHPYGKRRHPPHPLAPTTQATHWE